MNESDQSSIPASTIAPNVARSWLNMGLIPTDLSWNSEVVSHQATGKHADRVSSLERPTYEDLRLRRTPKDVCYHVTDIIDFAELNS